MYCSVRLIIYFMVCICDKHMNSNGKNRNILTHEYTKNIVRGKGLNNRDSIWKILTVIVLMEIITITPVISSFTNTVIITSTGQISTNYIVARSGNPQDIQAAVDAVAAAGGGTVYIPAGDWVFNIPSNEDCGVVVPGGVNLIGAGKDVTILRMMQPFQDQRNQVMIGVDGRNMKPTRISGITFIGNLSNGEGTQYSLYGLGIGDCKNFRVDHCKFIDFSGAGVGTDCYTTAVNYENGEYQYYWNWGLIDHCDFDNPYKETVGGIWAYGVAVFGPGRSDAWLYNLSDILGRWDIETNPIRCALYEWNSQQQKYVLVDPYGGKYFRWLVYIEDCTFKRCRHGIASNGGVFYVARHNHFEYNDPIGWPNVDVHGAMGNEGWWGGRGAEVYSNVIDETEHSGGWGIDYRGGGGVVFNNTIISCDYGVSMRYEGANTNVVCWVKDLWIWSNNFIDVTTTIYDPYNIYDEEVHYFLRQRSNYISYTYPHPLTLEVAP